MTIELLLSIKELVLSINRCPDLSLYSLNLSFHRLSGADLAGG
jgi:hypothetical protein